MAVGYPWTMEDTLDLEILMPEEEAESSFTLQNNARDPWQRLQGLGLLNGNRPTQLRRFMGREMSANEADYYRRHPHMAGARLHRLLVASFPNAMLRDRALAELSASPAIERVTVRQVLSQRQSPTDLTPKRAAIMDSAPADKSTQVVYPQEHLDRLNAGAAVQLAGGWGLVAVVDTGIEREHPEFKSFSGDRSLSGSFIPGGNYLPYFAVNLAPAGAQQDAGDVDEDQRSFVGNVPASCEQNGGPWIWPSHVGHGTHVAGLVAANGRDGAGVSGVCKDCGLGVLKASWNSCEGSQNQHYWLNVEYDTGTRRAVDQGAQVVNLSGGHDELDCLVADYGHTWCVAVRYASERDVFVAAASGNSLVDVQGPANSAEAIAVGGVDQSGAIWDDSPSILNPYRQCPYWPDKSPYPAPRLREQLLGHAGQRLRQAGADGLGSRCGVDRVHRKGLESANSMRRCVRSGRQFRWDWFLQRYIDVRTPGGGLGRPAAFDQSPGPRWCDRSSASGTARNSTSAGQHGQPRKQFRTTVGSQTRIRGAERVGSGARDAGHQQRRARAQPGDSLVLLASRQGRQLRLRRGRHAAAGDCTTAPMEGWNWPCLRTRPFHTAARASPEPAPMCSAPSTAQWPWLWRRHCRWSRCT